MYERSCGDIPAIAPNVASEEEIEVIELLGRLQASTARVSKAVRIGRMRLIARLGMLVTTSIFGLMYKVVCIVFFR